MTIFSDSSESKIFKNEQALSTEYLPDFLPHRETQIEHIARNLKPISSGRRPQNMFIFGPPGIGKTACIKFIFRRLQEFSERGKTIYINTWNYNTSTAVLTKIVLDLNYFIPRRGVSKDEVMEKLVEALKKTKKGIIICLDEVDQLMKKDGKVLYDLLRMNQYVDNPIGLVMISNHENIFLDTEPRIKSSLDVEDVVFKPYTLQEMKDILLERCKETFRSGVLEQGVVLLCANHAKKMGGDVRVGLECLRKSARISENEDSDRVKIKHVKQILKSVGSAKLKIMSGRLVGIDEDIVELLKNKRRVDFTDLHEEYTKLFGKISYYTFRKHIKHLEDIGMIKIRSSRKKTKGSKYFIYPVKVKLLSEKR